MINFRRHIVSLLFILAAGTPLMAQPTGQYMLADRLMQQQQYEAALDILKDLFEANPYEYAYYDRLVECHIQLKQYDEGLKLREDIPRTATYQPLANVLIAKLFHFKEDTAQAFRIWEQNLEDNPDYPDQLQLYMNTARAMADRELHLKAVEVYRKARRVFNSEQLFMTDIANELLQAGNYDEAIREWIQLIELRPDQLTYVQRMLLRFSDPLVYDITIIELDDKLAKLPLTSPAYNNLYQLQIWLLQENELYRRSLVTARAYENSTSGFNYSLYSLGRNLVDNKQFELAAEAFSYYMERGNGEVRWRSMEELAMSYSKWGKYLEDNQVDFRNRSDSLYQIASDLLAQLVEEGSTYSRLGTSLVAKAEIELDHNFNTDEVRNIIDQLEGISGYTESAELAYLKGRIHMAERAFTQARISFTQSNRRAEIGELAERTRYFLALTDFFTGDYEFSKIQLKTLGRQSTSYYANDALQLRVWLQKALSVDSTGAILEPFAEALFQGSIGNKEESRNQYLALLDKPEMAPLHDDIYLELSGETDAQSDLAAFSESIDRFLTDPTRSITLREKLMWQRAKFAEEAYRLGSQAENATRDKVIEFYEALILDYPQGFYAQEARKRLNELSTPNS